MSFFRFPYALAVCSALTLLFAANASAQTETRPRSVAPQTGVATTTTTSEAGGRTRLENDVMLVSEAAESEPEAVAAAAPFAPRSLGQFEQTMLSAIDARIGVPYRMGSEGPSRYDCSGFVWSVFQTAGVSFERSSARTFWQQFAPVDGAERYKFGTLVFFNGLAHVGIVADEHGFYHASTSRGVTYSPFNEYWTKRITGFRRVQLQPLAPTQIAAGR